MALRVNAQIFSRFDPCNISEEELAGQLPARVRSHERALKTGQGTLHRDRGGVDARAQARGGLIWPADTPNIVWVERLRNMDAARSQAAPMLYREPSPLYSPQERRRITLYAVRPEERPK